LSRPGKGQLRHTVDTLPAAAAAAAAAASQPGGTAAIAAIAGPWHPSQSPRYADASPTLTARLGGAKLRSMQPSARSNGPGMAAGASSEPVGGRNARKAMIKCNPGQQKSWL